MVIAVGGRKRVDDIKRIAGDKWGIKADKAKETAERRGLNAMAAALKYDPDTDYAPQISALGKGAVAESIIRVARETNVPVYRDEQLVNTLNKLKVGDDIPKELFEVVAQVLVFISRTDSNYAKKYASRM